MDPARWKQIDDLLDAALEVSEELRVNFVATHAAGDEDLRRQVMDLLAAQSNADGFLNNSAMQIAGRALAEDQTEISAFAFVDKTIATYHIERLLGAGGMGEVYLAFDQKLKRKVALKILPSEFLSNDERVKRFELEARAISSLNHPGIVTIYDVGNYEGVNYIATEYVEGKTVRELIGGKFKLRNIVLNSIQLCEALSAAHNAGIVHRDIKPENLMIRKDGYVKILDFGLAKLTDPGQQTLRDFAATTKGVIIGTPAYMSPAQISDEELDHRTDLWSCGVVLYEFLTGTNPFKGKNRQETFESILSKAPPPCSSINTEVPESLDRIIAKLLEKDASLGYQTAADLRSDLKRVKREFDSSPSWSGGSSNSLAEARNEGFDWSLYAASVMASFLVGFAIYYLFFSTPRAAATEWASAKNTQITFGPAIEAYPSLSPDGRSILYVTDEGKGDDIYLLRIGGSNPQNLTSDSPNRDTMPAYSPDGNRIAFRSDREPAGIYVMGATGENPKRVSDIGYSPSWSPDGKKLVVATGHQPVPSVRTVSELWTINIETGEKQMLVDSYALQPSWSPGGDRIAYWTTNSTGERRVETISVDGGESTVFASEGNTNWNPVWSPDGEFLYFASDRKGSMSFWRSRIDIGTGKPIGDAELVPTQARFNRHLTFSANNKRLAYAQRDNRSNIKMVNFDPVTEKVVGSPVDVTRGDFEFSSPELSPDGQRFFVRLIRKSQEDIVSVKTDGADIRDLTNDAFFDRYSRISPDGSKVLFVSDRSGSYQIWMMNSDGTNLKQMTPDGATLRSVPVWSPDGKRFSFDNESAVFIANIDEPYNAENLIKLPPTENGGWFRVWDWSRDGKLLAGNFDSAHGPGMGFYSLETGKYTRVIDHPGIPRWLPDNKRLIYLVGRRPYIVNIETKEKRELAIDENEEMRNVGVSFDGTKIYYTTFENESDIWLLDLTKE